MSTLSKTFRLLKFTRQKKENKAKMILIFFLYFIFIKEILSLYCKHYVLSVQLLLLKHFPCNRVLQVFLSHHNSLKEKNNQPIHCL